MVDVNVLVHWKACRPHTNSRPVVLSSWDLCTGVFNSQSKVISDFVILDCCCVFPLSLHPVHELKREKFCGSVKKSPETPDSGSDCLLTLNLRRNYHFYIPSKSNLLRLKQLREWTQPSPEAKLIETARYWSYRKGKPIKNEQLIQQWTLQISKQIKLVQRWNKAKDFHANTMHRNAQQLLHSHQHCNSAIIHTPLAETS